MDMALLTSSILRLNAAILREDAPTLDMWSPDKQ